MTTLGARTRVYAFTNGADGGNPSTFIQGSDTNFYGTTATNGANGAGTFFKISATGSFTALHSFTTAEGGATQLIDGGDGDYYATTPTGGTGSAGAVLQLTPAGNSATILTLTAPGYFSTGALCRASDGNFYGLTQFGGVNGAGTAFQITPAGTLTEIFDFNFATNGANPKASFIQDSNTGELVATTFTGGPNYDPVLNLGGTILTGPLPSISPNAVKQKALVDPGLWDPAPIEFLPDLLSDFQFWALVQFNSPPLIHVNPNAKLKAGEHPAVANPTPLGAVAKRGGDFDGGMLVNFQSDGTINASFDFGTTATDGTGPQGAPVMDAAGNIYGTTVAGGTAGLGTVYMIPAGQSGTGTTTTHTTLHSFVAATGSLPASNGLIIDGNGTIYGTTTAGGTAGGGVLFSITSAGTYKVLHNFQAAKDGVDGSGPVGNLIIGSDKNLYGATQFGGANNLGTVFRATGLGEGNAHPQLHRHRWRRAAIRRHSRHRWQALWRHHPWAAPCPPTIPASSIPSTRACPSPPAPPRRPSRSPPSATGPSAAVPSPSAPPPRRVSPLPTP